MGGSEKGSWPPDVVSLSADDRILFLTKDFELIKQQVHDGLNLKMEDLEPDDLLDDINTDVMTPAWVCFDWNPERIAENAYAGLTMNGQPVIGEEMLKQGDFKAIVSGLRKGTGSSRETAAQCERWSGIRLIFARSFAPIHERNNINLGQLMGDLEQLTRLQNGEVLPLVEFTSKHDSISASILESGGLIPFTTKLKNGEIVIPPIIRQDGPMTMFERLIDRKRVGGSGQIQPGDSLIARVDSGYSHEFTSAQVHAFLKQAHGDDYRVMNPNKFAVFEDHLLYASFNPRFLPFQDKVQELRDLQSEFQKHTGVRDYSAVNGISPGICHQVAREEFIDIGDFVQATDSHTCMGGSSNALAFGVGATEFAALIEGGLTFVSVPESIRFELTGVLASNVTAKDVMLYILANHAKNEETLDRAMEFGGPGLSSISMDERATLCNMATECSAKTGICEADEVTVAWLKERRGGDVNLDDAVFPDSDAVYSGGVHAIDLNAIEPMVATPGYPERGIPSDPTNGMLISDLGEIDIGIAYGGSCTAGKIEDIKLYAEVCRTAHRSGRKVAEGVDFFIQFGSVEVRNHAIEKGWVDLFETIGATIIEPGCGACIGAGPGISIESEQVTVSAINRNYSGRSGPGSLYLASPLTVAASAFTGKITAYEPEMFASI